MRCWKRRMARKNKSASYQRATSTAIKPHSATVITRHRSTSNLSNYICLVYSAYTAIPPLPPFSQVNRSCKCDAFRRRSWHEENKNMIFIPVLYQNVTIKQNNTHRATKAWFSCVNLPTQALWSFPRHRYLHTSALISHLISIQSSKKN